MIIISFIYKNYNISDIILKEISLRNPEYGTEIFSKQAIDTTRWHINHYTKNLIDSNIVIKESIEHVITQTTFGVNVLWHTTSPLLEKTIILQIVNDKRIAKLNNIPLTYPNFTYDIIYIPDKDFNMEISLHEQIFPYIHTTRDISYYLQNININKRIILYFDRIDRMFNHPDFYNLIYTLAHDSSSCKCYTIFLTISNRKHAKYISEMNGGEKFYQVRNDIIY